MCRLPAKDTSAAEHWLDPSSQRTLQWLGNSVHTTHPFQNWLGSARWPAYIHRHMQSTTKLCQPNTYTTLIWPLYSLTLEAGVVCGSHSTPQKHAKYTSRGHFQVLTGKSLHSRAQHSALSATLPATRPAATKPRQQARQPCAATGCRTPVQHLTDETVLCR